MRDSVDQIKELKGKVTWKGRLNIQKALSILIEPVEEIKDECDIRRERLPNYHSKRKCLKLKELCMWEKKSKKCVYAVTTTSNP